ncbi:MAG: hypothetical protein E7Z90_06740 [Cyanobacteria bacterium SIG29]|nr:hypothetical protein [Cyanobacteria bacterium SIG29]
MLNSEALYKDIFNVYAPLGYQINALIALIFGTGLIVFQYIGLCLTILISSIIYLISKEYTNKILATLLSVMMIFVCAYSPDISNWIMPYSYSILYSLLGFLLSFYFLVKYIKNDNDKNLMLSCLFYGFSVASKYEYSLFLFVIIAVILYKKTSIIKSLKSLGVTLFFPLLSFCVLLFQGNSVLDLYNGFISMCQLACSESVKTFYSYFGFNFSLDFLKGSYYIWGDSSYWFRSLGYICIFIFIFKLIFFIRSKEKSNDDFLQIILLLSAILGSYKCIGSIYLKIYGTFFLPLLFVAVISILYKFKYKNMTNIVLSIFVLFLMVSCFALNLQEIKNMDLKEIKTSKGLIKIKNIFYPSTVELLSYLEKNISKNNMVLILPEGSFINYLTDMKSDNTLYYLIPTNVEVLGNEKIINILNKNNIDYVIFSNIMYPDFLQGSFQKTYGKDIYDSVVANLKYEKTIGDDFIFKIYKVKN